MKLERRRISELMENPANLRLHGERDLAVVKGSFARFGQQFPIVVDSSGVVHDGNGRLAAARALGWEEIDVVVSDLSGPDLIAYGIVANRSAELSSWDLPALDAQLDALSTEGFDLDTDLGFSEAELGELLAEVGAPPSFSPTTADDQDEIDKLSPKLCPHCGKDTREPASH